MRRWIALSMFALLGASASTFISASKNSSAEEKAPLAARVFEMRTYTTNAGLLPQLHERFRQHTNYLFVKHGMQLIGYWTPQGEADTLVYILAYDSLEAREKSWKGFLDDEEWKRVYKASHEAAGGPIVKKVESKYLDPTDYSPIR
jgi:hypothetical protein